MITNELKNLHIFSYLPRMISWENYTSPDNFFNKTVPFRITVDFCRLAQKSGLDKWEAMKKYIQLNFIKSGLYDKQGYPKYKRVKTDEERSPFSE